MLDSTSFILSFDSCARGEAAIPLGLFNGDLAHIRDGQTVIHSFKHPQGTVIQQLLPDADGSVFAATNYGLLGWRNDKALTLTRKNGLPCEQVYAIAFDRSNDLWLYMNCALGLVTSADFQAWKQNPDITVPVRTFDALDGVRPNYASFVAGARSADGRLWFANGLSLQVIDPEHLSRNIVPPLVHIEQVIADRATYPAQGVLQLPPLTRNLEIDYAGLSFVAPQKVRFRYRLGGRDNAWQEPGTRRQAFYNDLRPGQYRFRVIACNNDGVWNEAGASFSFFVTPAWYQTRSFIIACFAAGVLLIMLLHWLRMRQATNALSARFDERLAERTRIAREFYDTLLQTIEGSQLVADDALDQPADPARMRRAVEQLSEWLSRAIQEGRAALQSLRTSTTETNDLAEGLHRATEECRMFSPMKTSLSVQGETREMHPVVRDEVYRIAYEAIRNACVHSKASELAVELKYSQDLSIRVSDNGVGIPAPLISHGKDGHYGLRGMRERAERIGGKLKVISSANSGTEITVVIPWTSYLPSPRQKPNRENYFRVSRYKINRIPVSLPNPNHFSR
jgi:signal transduction histidine kinase